MHTSNNVKIIIAIEGTPIIEKSTNIKFASLIQSKLDVQDFDAPHTIKHGRAWKFLDQEEVVRVQGIVNEIKNMSKEDKAVSDVMEIIGKLGMTT